MPTVSSLLYRLIGFLSKYIERCNNLFRLLPFFTSRPTRNSMDFLSKAIVEYYVTKSDSKLILHRNCLRKRYDDYYRLRKHDEKIYELDLNIYFRTFNDLSELEKEIIDLAYGDILDIGSCTGYYMPYLMEKGNLVGIDISDRIVNFAHERGLHNCVTGDIFTYKSDTSFYTITLVGNDIALSGSFYNLKKLLKKLYTLLTDDGQVLAIVRQIETLKYWPVVYTPEYEEQIGIPFKCLFLNVAFFMSLSRKYGFIPEIIVNNKSKDFLFYLVRLKKRYH